MKQLTFHEYPDPPNRSQSPLFLRVQEGMYGKHPLESHELETVTLRLAAKRGEAGFTTSDVLEEAGGRDRFPPNLIGSVVGRLRSRHALCVIGRERGKSPKGKGRWVNRFALNGEALEVAQ